MQKFDTEATITTEGELHLEQLPFHSGEKVHIVIYPIGSEENNRRAEYEMFMNAYAEEDSVYDLL